MQADPGAQQALLQVAELDTTIARLRHRRTKLPENEQLATLQAKRNQLGEQIVAAQTRLADAKVDLAGLEKDLAPVQARLKRNEEKIESGLIEQKALQPMLDEIENLKRRISTLEDSQLEIMQRLEDETALVERVGAERAEIETTMRGLLQTRDHSAADLDTQIENLSGQRETLAGRLPQNLMDIYHKVAARAGGTGAAELRARRCGGCGLELDVAELAKHAAAAPNLVLRCEECGRILVRTENSGL